ncbi:DUF2325 domain-containing protein [Caldimonas tepidiphila]|uniref:DUF2325 domain-containing protein n=1 Tax=Caldimonas tepidiphila TaxID=2315841 RepID=UPI000E5C0C56|nr:DUF2325 domain-containing protein [Caldimonas tepidiphila]
MSAAHPFGGLKALAALHGGPGELPALPAPDAPPAAAAARRRKLWELEDKHHCPVVGTCLPMDELQRFAKRFGFHASLRDEFALHVEAVGRSRTRNPMSEALQKYLDRKYALAIRRFESARSDAEVAALWQEHLARGDVAGPLWAACCHKASSPETRQRLYADVHMLSHQVGAGQAADARRLGHLEAENAQLRHELAAERLQRAHLQASWRDHALALEARTGSLAEQAAEAQRLRERLAQFESGEIFADMSRRLDALRRSHEQLCANAQRVWELQRTLEAAREEAERLAAERDTLAAERDALEQLLLARDADADEAAPPGAAASCAAGGSAPNCVLCVGGRTPLLPQYRALAARLGIRLIHHDGGQEEALSRLPDLIHSADAVLCPTDCVSHSAYYQLKNHCKRSGKPCLLFRGSGVSSFALALARLSGGQSSLSAAAEAAEPLRLS